MTTPDRSTFESDALGASLESSASAHELPPSVRAISVQSGKAYLFARRRRESGFSAQSHVLELAAGSILVLPENSEPSIQFRISGSSSTTARGLGRDARPGGRRLSHHRHTPHSHSPHGHSPHGHDPPSYTAEPSGCQCYFDTSSYDCACCSEGGCGCPIQHKGAWFRGRVERVHDLAPKLRTLALTHDV